MVCWNRNRCWASVHDFINHRNGVGYVPAENRRSTHKISTITLLSLRSSITCDTHLHHPQQSWKHHHAFHWTSKFPLEALKLLNSILVTTARRAPATPVRAALQEEAMPEWQIIIISRVGCQPVKILNSSKHVDSYLRWGRRLMLHIIIVGPRKLIRQWRRRQVSHLIYPTLDGLAWHQQETTITLKGVE